MKRLLVIGPNSYIAKHFINRVSQYHTDWAVETLSVRDDAWKKFDFRGYDSVVYCAAIVHKKETPELAEAYQKVNCDIPVEIAKQLDYGAQFLYLSTMAVFGVEGFIGREVSVDRSILPKPKSQYGKTKLAAETALQAVAAERDLTLAIFRPPMVYGKDCPGNYRTLEKFVLKFRVFPTLRNQRSMIHIGALCERILSCVEQGGSGTFHPQDRDYVCTLDMACDIAEKHQVKLLLIPLLNPLVRFAGRFSPVFHKVWGNLVYDKEIDRK